MSKHSFCRRAFLAVSALFQRCSADENHRGENKLSPGGRVLSWRGFSITVSFLVFALLAWRQHVFVDRYSVNMMFWDQWDFYLPFFNDEGSWAVFTRQHGPHRQGAGFLVTRLLTEFSGWDSRWDAFGVSFTLILGSLAGLAVALRCGCKAWLTLPVLGLLFFNLRQYEVFVGASNLSHGAFPVLLLMLYAWAWMTTAPVLRSLLVGGLTFLIIFTGFGIFAGLLTPPLCVLWAIHAFRAHDKRQGWLAIGTLIMTAFAWMVFARGYVFAPAVDNFHFPHARPWEYFYFVGVMLSNFCGIAGPATLAVVCGLLLTAGLAALCVCHGWRIARNGLDKRRSDVVIFIFSAFVLLYCLNTAVGRISLGFTGAAQASRYVTLLIPAGLAAWIALARITTFRATAIGSVCAGLLAAGTLVLSPADWRNIRWFHDGRAAWKAAYLSTRDETVANERSGFKVYPAPGKITDRLHYLEQHRLNLFKDEP